MHLGGNRRWVLLAGVVLVITLGTCGWSPLFDLAATNTCDVDSHSESGN